MKSFTAVARTLAAFALAAFVGAAVAQQTYPSKPIRFIVAFPPGGSTDLVARLVGQKLTESWGQPVVIDNRPGGNSVIATEAVAKSAPDGHTLLLTTSTLLINPNLFANLPYNWAQDFAPVTTLATTEFVLVAHPSVAAKNLQELIALAKSKPNQLNYGSSSIGGPTHLGAVLFEMLTGAHLQHIPYKGGSPVLTDLLSGQVQLALQVPASVIAYIRSGKLRAIAISGEARSRSLPEVPTFAEAGLQGFNAGNWFGVIVTAGTPKEIIDKLATAIRGVLATPDIRDKLASQGMEPLISTPDQFAAMMRAEAVKFAKIIKSGNIKLAN